MADLILSALKGIANDKLNLETLNTTARTIWSDTVAAADQHNDPGAFATFTGFEYTTTVLDSGNLHRNVIFRVTDKLPVMLDKAPYLGAFIYALVYALVINPSP